MSPYQILYQILFKPFEESRKLPPVKVEQKRARNDPASTGKYSDTLRGIQLSIINRRHPDTILDQGEADLLQEVLVEQLSTVSSDSDSAPQFLKTSYSAKIIWMTCTNKKTVDWLSEMVDTLERLWEEEDLTVVQSKDLLRRPRVLVFFPDLSEVDRARILLQIQNQELKTKDWLLMSRKIEKEGQLIAFSIDVALYQVLERSQIRAYYRRGRVTFRVLKQPAVGDQDATDQPTAL